MALKMALKMKSGQAGGQRRVTSDRRPERACGNGILE
jgi:hypothetical protein